MEKRTEKVPTIALEDLTGVMKEVSKELKLVLSRALTREEQEAVTIFLGTLSAVALKTFGYLPSGQQDEILTHCGTWFDIGMLLGKSPKLLVEILKRVNPKVVGTEIPDRLANRSVRGKQCP